MLLFLKYNLRAVGYNSLRLPIPPKNTDQGQTSSVEDITDNEEEEDKTDEDNDNESGDETASFQY